MHLAEESTGRHNGSRDGRAPMWGRAHPVTANVAVALGLFMLSGTVAGCAAQQPQAVPETTPSAAREEPAALVAPTSPSARPIPEFDLVAAQMSNAVAEDQGRSTWSSGYETWTTGDPISTPLDTPDTRTGATITYVIDGDTVVTKDGDKIRIIGIDSPEHGVCGFIDAKTFAETALRGAAVTLIAPSSEPNKDKYGRLLRYIELADGSDFGLLQIQQGNAAARYDGYDGYSAHPRQDTYHQADDAVTHRCGDENPARTGVIVAPAPEPAMPAPLAQLPAAPPAAKDVWNMPGPDLDCKDIGKMVWVDPPDYHNLDRDGDGWGCESYR